MNAVQFMDFEFETQSSALSPRRETEILTEKAIEYLKNNCPSNGSVRVLDVGTGCGNIAISLTNYIPSSRIVALDISGSAIRAAIRNAGRYGVLDRIEFIESDLFESLRNRNGICFDLVVSNPPYVNLEDFLSLPDEVRNDPYIALYGGRDGAECYRRIIKDAYLFLKPGGALIMELGYDTSSVVKDILFSNRMYGRIEVYKDYSGINRVIMARKA